MRKEIFTQNENMNIQLRNIFENDRIVPSGVEKNKLRDKCVQNWTLSDALKFLAEHHLQMYKKTFTQNCIDGEVKFKVFLCRPIIINQPPQAALR